MNLLFNFATWNFMIMTKYLFKGEEISHTRFLSICRQAGLQNPRKRSMHEQLKMLATEGNERAIGILNDLNVIEESHDER